MVGLMGHTWKPIFMYGPDATVRHPIFGKLNFSHALRYHAPPNHFSTVIEESLQLYRKGAQIIFYGRSAFELDEKIDKFHILQ